MYCISETVLGSIRTADGIATVDVTVADISDDVEILIRRALKVPVIIGPRFVRHNDCSIDLHAKEF